MKFGQRSITWVLKVRYRIDYTDEARLALRTLPGRYRQRARKIIEALVDNPWPSHANALRELPNCFRIRVDGWRIVYRVKDESSVVVILRVGRHAVNEVAKGGT